MGSSELLDDRFELEATAGEGSFGVVHRARDHRTGARVAVKLWRSSSRDVRFEREAELLSRLSHRHIVRYVSHGIAEGHPYLAMEWLDGETLAARLEREPLSVEQTLALGRACASALGHAHDLGAVHRDLKPGNVFLVDGRADDPRVVDFGIALQAKASRSTLQGLTVGTPTYMAPEQAQHGSIDARADVFALGCVLFECLAGRPAFQATNRLALMTKVLLEDPPPLREVITEAPVALEALVARMTCKEREQRPSDGRAVASALEEVRLDVDSAPVRYALTASEQSLVSVLVVGRASDHRAAHLTLVDAALDGSVDGDMTDAADRAGGTDPVAVIAARYGGRREFLRDGAAAVLLRANGSATEQAIRAARCGIELRDLARGAPVALATGLARLGARAPVGAVIDRVAEQLEDAADAELVIDDVTARLLPRRFLVVDDRLIAEEREEHEAAAELRFVGREREMSMLEEQLRRAAESQRASVTVVRGDPGVGKSRLRRELLRRGDTRWAVGFGWGDPMRTGTPHGVLAPLLESLLGLPSEHEPEAKREVLIERLATLFRSPELERVAAFLAEAMGIPFDVSIHPALQVARLDERTMRSETERALWELLDRASARHPVLLVLEDLQWCDHSTIELIDTALLYLESRPFAVLAFARPDVGERLGTPWAERGPRELTLSPLSADAAKELAREALGEAAAPALDDVVERAGGNPFYIEEIARAERARPEGAPLPDTVSALVRARLDRMPDEARRVLRAASVLGDPFDARTLETLLAGRAQRWLTELVSRDFLIRVEPYEGRRFAFRSSLLRETAYGTLTEPDRALGHRLAAEHFERQASPPVSAIAHHYERGGEPKRAIPWWVRGARAALEAHATGEALAHAQRGLDAGARGKLRTELRLIQAGAARLESDWPLVQDAAEHVLPKVDALGEAWWEALWWAALAHRAQGNREIVASYVAMARQGIGAAVLHYRSLAHVMRIAKTALRVGEVPSAIGLLAAVDEHLPAGEIPYVALRAERLAVDAQLKLLSGDLGAFLESMRESYQISDEAGLDFTALAAAPNLGFAFLLVGAYDQAERVLRAGVDLARSLRAATVEAWTRHNLGLCLMYTGQLEEALEAEREAIRHGESAGDRPLLANAYGYLAAIHLALEEVDLGEAAAARAIEIGTAVAPPAVPYARAVHASAALLRGDAAEAVRRLSGLVSEIDAGRQVEDGEALVRLVHAEALMDAGVEREALEAIQHASARIHARAALISDELHRESFLERVPENARTLALARHWTS